ncbi:hypothetical protein ASPWEDRAFT_169256 [Aspergillus wentii DTO 134E9]|uniref:Uncharacterized protein n=1 Tax=Aspergillus wentii DTO 134E9 TaxID=1073089 RepID=A0A1L9RWU9_ASPWE|nr:uncharacterized protein ASPWEDRAFT_169256 [Aspergillus wentii DTO 134E9]OJJ39409.1 hypothetical protein ASPWEDRAFT_169256 [Aspergillus wentii DTO 134E9]
MSQEQETLGDLELTDSHDSPQVEPEENELVPQSSNTKRLSDTAWKQASRSVDEELVSGLSNEDLWLLVRRFNKQIYYVKAAPDAPVKELDLNRAEDEHFPPEKLRMTLERFYTSVVVGLAGFFKQIARLRSWKEPRRTSIFCAVYFVMWLLDSLALAFLGALVSLVVFPPCRTLLFPPAPIALVDGDTGSVKKPQAGELGYDSITGAPERYKGEAAEQEARNLVNSVAGVAMESAAAKYGQGVVPEEDSAESPISDTMEIATTAAGDNTEDAPADDKTKKPMKKKVIKATNQTMRVVSDITDIWEKFANALSPTPPFSAITPRLRLAGILVSICLAIHLTSSYLVIKAGAFAVGFGFFGDPVIQSSLDFLNNRIPDWKKHLDLQNSLLKGVPTNAQLTLTLLRIGEINTTPLPPPPTSQNNEPQWPIRRSKSSTTTSSGGKDKDTSTDLQRQGSDESLSAPKSKRRWVVKVLRFFRRTIATAIKSHIAVDRAMAIAGSAHTKNLVGMVGMLRQKGWISAPYGPIKFDAKYERKRGAVVIDSSKEPPILYFTTYQSSGLDDLRLESRKKGSVLFQIPVTDIKELKKTEGLGWKGKLIVELTAGSKEAADGLIIVGKETDQSYHITGMRSRNELFNRLVAIDAQFWESR